MGRKTLNNQIQHTLTQKNCIGESRHKAKEELKQEYAQRGEKFRLELLLMEYIAYLFL